MFAVAEIGLNHGGSMGLTVEPRIGAFADGLWMTIYEASIVMDAARVQASPPIDRHLGIDRVA